MSVCVCQCSQLCQAKGFVCEFCGNDKDIIFPFQLNKCQRCEGEHSLLVAGLGGSRTSSPRPSISVAWRDWKISKPRSLARVLLRDRTEGEGGEEGADVGETVTFEDERDHTAKLKQGRGAVIHARGKLVKACSWQGNEEEQETTGGTESEREAETRSDKAGDRENGQHVKLQSKQWAVSQEKGDGHVRKEKVNLLKVLQLDRLKRNVRNRRDSDSESLESQDELGQERKQRWNVSRLASLTKGFSKRETEEEGKTGIAEEEERLSEKVNTTQEEGKTTSQAEDDSSAENMEKPALMTLFKPRQLSEMFFRGRRKVEEDRSGEIDIKRERAEPAIVTQNTWRSCKTRRARRITRGRKIREESATEGGDSTEIDEDSEKGGGQDDG